MQHVDAIRDYATVTHIFDKVFKNLNINNSMRNFIVLWCDFHMWYSIYSDFLDHA